MLDHSRRLLTVLLVEDADNDVWLLRRALQRDRIESVRLKRARRLDEAVQMLELGGIDVILLDLSLPDSFGMETVGRALAAAGTVPIVVLTSVADGALGLGAIHEGAQDYLVKGQVSGLLLDRALRYAIERRQHEERGRQLAEEQAARELAEQTLLARDEFLSVAAHELYTPITALQLSVQSSLRDLHGGKVACNGAAFSRKLEIVERQAQRLVRLVGALLEVSRIHMGRVEFEVERVDLAAVVRDVALVLEPERAKAGSALHLECEPGMTGLWDRSRIERVVTNLVSNALKYGHGRPVDVVVTGDSDKAILRVTDRGIGISPEMQARIFQRFERAAPSRQYGGLGLGLYVVHTIVSAFGGSVGVASRPGQGSTFTVELPRAAQTFVPVAPARVQQHG